jgi:membrane-associated phospholipid phosphatase
VNDRDWGRFLRSLGYLPLWIAIAAATWLHDRRGGHGAWRGASLVLAPALGGGVAELAKLLVRRLRPDPTAFGYVFRAWDEATFSTRGLGMPSSHVMVAFAGAAALARVVPGSAPVGYLLAAGCALTRVLSGQHYLSDTVVAGALGWLVGDLVARRLLRRSTLSTSHVPP